MPITMRELGKATGFSVATFSRVLNDRLQLVSYETKQQLLAKAKELGYRPNLIEHRLHSGPTNTIGLILDNYI
jgi:LacI family transcriptional regulator